MFNWFKRKKLSMEVRELLNKAEEELKKMEAGVGFYARDLREVMEVAEEHNFPNNLRSFLEQIAKLPEEKRY
ncbi:hypothetical protein ACFLZC_01580 [Patescibacteria group bacterium]